MSFGLSELLAEWYLSLTLTSWIYVTILQVNLFLLHCSYMDLNFSHISTGTQYTGTQCIRNTVGASTVFNKDLKACSFVSHWTFCRCLPKIPTFQPQNILRIYTYLTISKFISRFLDESGLARPPLGISGTGFYEPAALPVTQPRVSKHWRKFKALSATSVQGSSFLHTWPAEDNHQLRKGAMLALCWCTDVCILKQR